MGGGAPESTAVRCGLSRARFTNEKHSDLTIGEFRSLEIELCFYFLWFHVGNDFFPLNDSCKQ